MKILTVLFVSLLIAVTTAFSQTQSRIELRADMSGIGKGKVVFKTRGSQAELQWEGERLPRNQTYTLVIGTWISEVATDSLGRGRLSLRFNASNRPTIVPGTVATLYDSNNLIVNSGVFAVRR